jgi:hypothetical protein
MARLTRTAWFGPKRHAGWGWTPTSWLGWAVTAVWTLAVVAGTVALVAADQFVWMVVFWVVTFLVYGLIVVITGDPPGGPGFGGHHPPS